HACAARAGVDQMTRTAAMEWGPLGIRVNGIAPGPIDDTEGMRRLAPNEAVEKAIINSLPARRLGTKDEIAKATMWLCSDDASYITGVILPVDGGWSLGGSGSMQNAMTGG
ncbi:MAG: SDR family oxidoreductase, partial [Panacagrimonas sp.]